MIGRFSPLESNSDVSFSENVSTGKIEKTHIPSIDELTEKLRSIIPHNLEGNAESDSKLTNFNQLKEEKNQNATLDVWMPDEHPSNRKTEDIDNQNKNLDKGEINKPIQNKIDGLAREHDVEEDLKKKYPADEGYTIVSEAYLRNKDGAIVKDSETGEARRIDFVVIKGGKAVDSIEVTSCTADKRAQTAKEDRIRESGGNFIRDSSGNLIEIPATVQTRIERRD